MITNVEFSSVKFFPSFDEQTVFFKLKDRIRIECQRYTLRYCSACFPLTFIQYSYSEFLKDDVLKIV